MDNTLEAFLALPNVDEIEEEVFVSNRVGTFKVKAMSQDEFREYQRISMGKIGKKGADFDVSKFYLAMVAGQTVFPNFNDKTLLDKTGCVLGTELVKKKLLSGEIAELAKSIQRISGFDNDLEEDIVEAKN